jgi:murein DD-endopeptidase MepM/ murein hydrolase activator NlpD
MIKLCSLAALALLLLLLPTRLYRWAEHFAPRPAPLEVFRGTVTRRATLASLLAGRLEPTGVDRLVKVARPVYDLARLSVGHPFGLALSPDGVLAAFTYGIDELRTLRVTREAGDLKAELVARSYDPQVATLSGVVVSSLFAAVTEAGAEDELALALADVFAWDVDFNTEIQKGDSFRVAVEELTLDGRFCRYGRILAAEFVRGERVLQAVRFDSARGSGYFAPDGTPLRRAFLRSPLQFSRISSGFSRSRLHPILQENRPHLGVDYAAPVGTPVLAAGNGTVTLVGWLGGFGNTVRLRHPNGYETLYGHLSRTLVRVGQRVTQGTPIGAVGMTGLATGPHLDYRMSQGGVFVNPLAIRSPPAEPLTTDERPAFEDTRRQALALLEAPPPARAGP